ncbi:MAG: class I SAM-dependent methyltransferase [Rhodocyclaceae bacterium]
MERHCKMPFMPKDAPHRNPSPDAQAASRELCSRIASRIRAEGGWLSFADYMEMALYSPGLGYYAGGAHKFGVMGDFVTAPELTPLFGQALARQVAQILHAVSPAPNLLEAGAGSGKLAADLLLSLEALDALPLRYEILELSGELRARQRQTIETAVPHLADRVVWLDELPEAFIGCVIANELLDALPVHAVAWRESGLMERGVTLRGEGFGWAEERPAQGALAEAMAALPVEAPFESEIGLAARAWVAEWGRRLERGALLLIDYGLPRQELYHPLRNRGTLRCHYQQRLHDDPFWWPGLSDITAHVDFTALAEAGFEAGLDVLGYASQATFLINCGIGELFTQRRSDGRTLAASGALQMLLSPHEMGEMFKVLALGKAMEAPLMGFEHGDRTHAL